MAKEFLSTLVRRIRIEVWSDHVWCCIGYEHRSHISHTSKIVLGLREPRPRTRLYFRNKQRHPTTDGIINQGLFSSTTPSSSRPAPPSPTGKRRRQVADADETSEGDDYRPIAGLAFFICFSKSDVGMPYLPTFYLATSVVL